MAQEVFRKKSLDRIKSPESLNDYLKVSNPGVWILLLAVIFLLMGVFVWSVFGQIDTTLNTVIVAEEGNVAALIPVDQLERVAPGMSVTVNGETVGTVVSFGVPGEDSSTVPARLDAVLAEGVYSGQIVIEAIRPISFVIN